MITSLNTFPLLSFRFSASDCVFGLGNRVFPAEACDDLGGEFCEPDYQKDVY